jgi:hypothetical protein
MQIKSLPVFLPVEPQQIHEKLLDALTRGFWDVHEDTVIRPANHGWAGA